MRVVTLEEALTLDPLTDFNTPFVIPTETVYGLAARSDSDAALRAIYALKGRPSDNPLILHISEPGMLQTLVDEKALQAPLHGGTFQTMRAAMDALIAAFWPGPLTLVFPSRSTVSRVVQGGSAGTVAVRMPRHPRLRALIARIGVPLAAPSANTSGRPSPTRVEHATADLGSRVELFIDGGPCEIGLESTVFGFPAGQPTLLRPGAVTHEQLERVLQMPVAIAGSGAVSHGALVLSPGMKYKHYAPSIPVVLFQGTRWRTAMATRVQSTDAGRRVGLMATDEVVELRAVLFFAMGHTPTEWAQRIFQGLRELDGRCDVIYVQGVENTGVWRAVTDRVTRAASEIVHCD